MSIIKAAAIAATLSICALPAGVLAASSTLQLIIGGEAYDGPPRFEVSFDGKPLGERAVDAAIDTVATGRFADATDKTPYVQSFEFDIPDDVFKPGGEVRVRLLNEAYGGDGSNHDRNLYLAAVAVNGRAVTVSGLSTQGTKAKTDNETVGEFLVLRDGNVEGVSRPPSGGWPLPGAALAAAPEPDSKPVVEEAKAVVAQPPEPAEQPAKAPAVVADLKPGAGDDPAKLADDAVETASIDSNAAAPKAEATGCDRDELYNVIGFNESSNDLTPKLMTRLDQIVADIGTQKCRVTITGYSSAQGNNATSALFAIERAQNVLTYLKHKGVAFEKAQATGGGATDQFGDTPGANRRVVIAVAP